MAVENLVVAIGLELIAVMRVVVVLVFRREMLEVHGLTRIGPDAGGDEHQP
ncbi:putative metallopeptidase [Bradyrhizobium sp. LM4.3]